MSSSASISVSPSARSDGLILALIVILHAAVLGMLWHSPSAIPEPDARPVLYAALIEPAPPAPAPPEPEVTPPPPPKPQPTVKKKPAPPVLAVPEVVPVAAPPVVQTPEPVAPPPEPVAAAEPAEPVPAPAVVAAPPPVIPPRFDAAYLDNPAPTYPSLSRRLREEGTVLLRVYVEADGRPAQIELKQSSGHARLDAVAREAVQRWRFVAARQGDAVVAAWVVVPITFNLRS